MSVERYSHVMHIVSTVVGQVAPGQHRLRRAGRDASRPARCPARPSRGRWRSSRSSSRPGAALYGGCVGYLDFAGDLDTAIAIRTALLRDGVAYVQAGGGIVADSDAERRGPGVAQQGGGRAACRGRGRDVPARRRLSAAAPARVRALGAWRRCCSRAARWPWSSRRRRGCRRAGRAVGGVGDVPFSWSAIGRRRRRSACSRGGARRGGRRARDPRLSSGGCVGVLLALAGAGVVAVGRGRAGRRRPAAVRGAAAQPSVGRPVGGDRATYGLAWWWPSLAVVGRLPGAAGGLVTAVRSGALAGDGGALRRAGRAGTRPADAWTALDRGDDPTLDPGAGRPAGTDLPESAPTGSDRDRVGGWLRPDGRATRRPAQSTGHGNSVAAWTAVVVIICLGGLISAVAFSLRSPWLFWVGWS